MSRSSIRPAPFFLRAALLAASAFPIVLTGVSAGVSLRAVEDCVLSRVSGALGGSAELRKAIEHIRRLKEGTVYGEVPDVHTLSISGRKPERFTRAPRVSAGVADPILERARELHVYEDFKYVSDLKPKKLKSAEIVKLETEAREAAAKLEGDAAEKAYLKTWIEGAYDHAEDLVPVGGEAPALWKVSTGDAKLDAAFTYAENAWSKLLRKTSPGYGDSHLVTPYPTLVPGGRFSEHYNWDMYFGVEGALATKRLEIAQMQVENLLEDIRKYGFVPNGGRDYYLTRSQPPMLSSMVKNVYEASIAHAKTPAETMRLEKWLRDRALPLLEGEYRDFWMNPKTRFDPKTGLNRHWDEIDLPRPERHGADDELALGKSYRDVRAAAESGLDFTDLFQGEATQVGSVLLNSVLGKVEQDLVWMARRIGDPRRERQYLKAFEKRKAAVDRYLWNRKKGRYENRNLRTRKFVGGLGADTYAPLFAGLASPEQAKAVLKSARKLTSPGGVMGSDLMKSTHQWDGANGWAPFQYFAISGLKRYGFKSEAEDLARRWTNALAKTVADDGTMYERIDVLKLSKPVEDGTKYNPQPDFLWSIGTFQWALTDVLGVKLLSR